MARKVKPETRAKRMAEPAPPARYDQAFQRGIAREGKHLGPQLEPGRLR